MRLGQKLEAEMIKRLREPWQKRSFIYYSTVPEIHYGSQFYSRHMSKIELRAEVYDPDSDEWRPDPDSETSEFLDRIQDPQGGRATLIGTYGRLRFLIGECYLCCFDPDTDEERWEVLSTSELRVTGTGEYERIKIDGTQGEKLRIAPDDDDDFEPVPNTVIVYRLWRRHPEFSMQADAPLRAVLDICEELLLLTLAVRAQARSRISRSGILRVPSEISPPPPEPRPGEDPQEDKFLINLERHMSAPLADEGSAAQLVPLFVRGPAAYLQQLTQLELNTAGNYPEAELRAEAISRLANGLDMPREALLGTADVNHWGAWQIDQQTWEAHVQPVVEEMCEELTTVVLRPSLEQNGMTRGEAKRRRIWYDPVKIVNHPDRGKDAMDAYDRGELSGKALRMAKGFNDEDAPNQAELARWVGVRVRDGGLAWYGKPTLKSGGSAESGTPLDEGDDETETTPPDGGTGNDVAPGPPGEEAARLLGAAETALYTCRRTAGSRIIQKLGRAETRQYQNIPRHRLYALLGRDALTRGNGDLRPEDLVRGGTEPFEHILESWGYPPERVAALASVVRQHAADTLHQAEPPALPPVLLNL